MAWLHGIRATREQIDGGGFAAIRVDWCGDGKPTEEQRLSMPSIEDAKAVLGLLHPEYDVMGRLVEPQPVVLFGVWRCTAERVHG